LSDTGEETVVSEVLNLKERYRVSTKGFTSSKMLQKSNAAYLEVYTNSSL
jgi:hypothetical protein